MYLLVYLPVLYGLLMQTPLYIDMSRLCIFLCTAWPSISQSVTVPTFAALAGGCLPCIGGSNLFAAPAAIVASTCFACCLGC